MNLINDLNYTYGLEYFGLGDMSTNWELSFLENNENEIIEYLDNLQVDSVQDIETYVSFLWFDKMSKLREALPHLTNQDTVPKLSNILDKIDLVLSSFKKRDIIQFLKKNYQEVFDCQIEGHYVHDMKMISVEYIFANSNSFSDECFDFIEKKYWYLIVDDFSHYMNFYKKHIERFKCNIVNEKIAIENIKNYNRIFKLLELCNRKPFEDYLKGIVSKVSIEVLGMVENINLDNYLEIITYFDNAEKISKLYKDQSAYEFDKLRPKLNDFNNEYLEKRGHKFTSEPVDLHKAIEDLKNNSTPDLINFMTITHKYEFESNSFVSIFDGIMTAPSSLVDHVTHIGVPKDDYFIPSRLQHLRVSFDLFNHFMYGCLTDEDLQVRLVVNYHKVLSNLYNEGIIEKIYIDEYLGMCNLFSSLLEMKDDNKLVKKSLSYSVAMLIGVYIEKLLRAIYISKMIREDYIDVSSLSLNSLLNTKELEEYLGLHLQKVLEYKLTYKNKTSEGVKLGENLRNSLMHGSGSLYEHMNIGYPTMMFYLLVSILNSIASNYIDISDKKEDVEK